MCWTNPSTRTMSLWMIFMNVCVKNRLHIIISSNKILYGCQQIYTSLFSKNRENTFCHEIMIKWSIQMSSSVTHPPSLLQGIKKCQNFMIIIAFIWDWKLDGKYNPHLVNTWRCLRQHSSGVTPTMCRPLFLSLLWFEVSCHKLQTFNSDPVALGYTSVWQYNSFNAFNSSMRVLFWFSSTATRFSKHFT